MDLESIRRQLVSLTDQQSIMEFLQTAHLDRFPSELLQMVFRAPLNSALLLAATYTAIDSMRSPAELVSIADVESLFLEGEPDRPWVVDSLLIDAANLIGELSVAERLASLRRLSSKVAGGSRQYDYVALLVANDFLGDFPEEAHNAGVESVLLQQMFERASYLDD